MKQAYVKPPQGACPLICVNFIDDQKVPRIGDLKGEIFAKIGVYCDDLVVATEGGLCMKDDDFVFDDDNQGNVETVRVFNLRSHLLGGKGGFGSMLRAQGGRMSSQKTTNFEACRDLSGHRFRTLNLAKKLAAKKAREAEQEKESEEKLEKRIKRYMKDPTTSRVRVDDSKFLNDHEKAMQSLEMSFEKASKRNADSRANLLKSRKSRIVSTTPKPDLLSYEDEICDILS